MTQFWIPLVSTSTDVINSRNGVTLNQPVAAFLGANPGSYVEWDDATSDPADTWYPNLVFTSSETSTFACVVNGLNVTANILTGGHTTQRPK